MKHLLPLLFAFFSLSLTGCLREPAPANPQANPETPTVTQLGIQVGELNSALRNLHEDRARQLSKIGASADVGLAYTQKLPESPERRVVDAEVRNIQRTVGDGVVRPEDALEATKRSLLLFQGKFEEASKLYEQAALQAREQQAARLKLEEQLAAQEQKLQQTSDQLKTETENNARELEALRSQHAQQLADQQAKYTAQLRKLEDAELRKQQWWLRGLGLLCILATIGLGVAAGAPTPGVLKRAGILVPCGMLCFALAQMIGKTWFMTAFYCACGLVLLAVIGVIVWVGREAVLKQRAASKAEAANALLTSTAAKITKAGDSLYENATSGQQVELDAKYFERLSEVMSDNEKAVVHLLRAGDKAKQSLVASAVKEKPVT